MIRVGGGWDTLEHYLDRHDPCRCGFQGNDLQASFGLVILVDVVVRVVVVAVVVVKNVNIQVNNCHCSPGQKKKCYIIRRKNVFGLKSMMDIAIGILEFYLII